MNYRKRRCPHCGRTNGLYQKMQYKNIETLYDFSGNNTEDNMDNVEIVAGKKLYCQVCGRFVCKAADYKAIYGRGDQNE